MFLGRERELEIIRGSYEKASQGRSRLVLIRGEAGVGKTTLVKSFLDSVDCVRIEGTCSPILTPPLYPIREALAKKGLENLLGIPESPKILMLYVVNDDGLLLAKVEREDFAIDADIFTSMLTAVSMFVKDSLGALGEGSEYLEELRYGNYNLVMKKGKKLTLVSIIEGKTNEFLHRDLDKLLAEIEEKYLPVLEAWDGNMAKLSGMEERMLTLINSGKYDGGLIEVSSQNWNFENLRLGLGRWKGDRTLCLFVDDLQWADETTLALIHYLARGDDGFLIIGTYRSEERGDALADLEDAVVREELGEIIELKPLGRNEVLALLENFFSREVSLSLLDYVYTISGGVPLNVLEIAKILLDENLLEERDSLLHLRVDPEILPDKMESIVRRRMRKLGNEEREVILFSSVLGQRVIPSLLSCALGMRKHDVLRILRNLINKGIMRRDEEGYSFHHEYIREAIYRSLDDFTKREYHTLAADCLEDVDIDEDLRNAIRAEHYYNAGNCEKGIDYALLSAMAAKEKHAYSEAVRFASIALECAKKLKDVEREEEINLLLGDLNLLRGDFYKARENFEEALNIRESKEAHVGIGKSLFQMGNYAEAEMEFRRAMALADDEREVMINLGNVEMKKGNFEKARGYLKAYLDWAKSSGGGVSRAYESLGLLYLRTGEYGRAEELFREALHIAEERKSKSDIATALHNISLVHYLRGENEDAMEHAMRAIDIIEGIGEIRLYPKTANLLGLILWNLGRVDESVNYFKLSRKYANLLGNTYDGAAALANIGMIQYYSRRFHEAAKVLKEAISLWDKIGARVERIESYLYLVSAEVEIGKEVEDVLESLEEDLYGLNLQNYEVWISILRMRILGDVDRLDNTARSLEDPLMRGIAYQHLWSITEKDEYRVMAIKNFSDAGFEGAMAFFTES